MERSRKKAEKEAVEEGVLSKSLKRREKVWERKGAGRTTKI